MTIRTSDDLRRDPTPAGATTTQPSGALPATVVDVELSAPIDEILRHDGAKSFREAWLLVRVFDEPIALVKIPFPRGADRLDAATIGTAIAAHCGDAARTRIIDAGGDAASALAGDGTDVGKLPAFLAAHERWRESGPEMTVAICTRNRATDLRRALDSLRGQSYQRFTVLVVDNAPSDDSTRALVMSRPADERIDYVEEPRPGLSWARNRALEVVTTPVIAWLDDDEIADRHWLIETAAAYCQNPDAAAVSGVVVPAELRTLPQLWFEEFGGHSKGRGFRPDRFTAADARQPGGQSPLYPLPPFGVGANMSFDVQQLRAIGGFDNALGAGTLTQGGEDTLAFSQLLLAGGVIVYAPASVTRHFHRPDYAGLTHQMRGYGIGLTAYYTSLLRSNWRLLGPLLRLAPQALRDTGRGAGRGGGGAKTVPDSFPRELLRAKKKAMAQGPWLYLRARRNASRLKARSR
ncbi:MAG: glycosyltransferase family 2 protein [Acidothermaceae bacterium]